MQHGSLVRNPADLLLHDHFHQKDLFADYERLVPGERTQKAELIRRITDELQLHFRIEERLLYPSLLATKSKAVLELVKTARSEHRAILDACRILARADDKDQDRLMKALFKQVEVYVGFEEKRLLPRIQRLPGVTLRQMTLEMEEMKGKR